MERRAEADANDGSERALVDPEAEMYQQAIVCQQAEVIRQVEVHKQA